MASTRLPAFLSASQTYPVYLQHVVREPRAAGWMLDCSLGVRGRRQSRLKCSSFVR